MCPILTTLIGHLYSLRGTNRGSRIQGEEGSLRVGRYSSPMTAINLHKCADHCLGGETMAQRICSVSAACPLGRVGAVGSDLFERGHREAAGAIGFVSSFGALAVKACSGAASPEPGPGEAPAAAFSLLLFMTITQLPYRKPPIVHPVSTRCTWTVFRPIEASQKAFAIPVPKLKMVMHRALRRQVLG